jgi:serine/threonine protein kinase
MQKLNWVGQTIGGRYQIEKLLGQGGMSAVYQAIDPNLKRVVAIKLIHPHLSVDPSFVDRFKTEAAVIASLRHPNIVQVHDFNNEGETYYMVMEYLAGETLQGKLKRLNAAGRHMDFTEVLKIAIQITDAAGYAHNHNLIHRDIKPANIMLDINNQAILMDFGIVKIVGGEYHTATGATIGTAMYMSPEQIRGERVDERSDIYSLGVMLYEMLSGQPPYKADSAMTLMMMVLNDPLPNLREHRNDVPEYIQSVVEKALEKDKKDRYQMASEFLTSLERVQQMLTIPEPEMTIPDEIIPKVDIRNDTPPPLEAIVVQQKVDHSEREKEKRGDTTIPDNLGEGKPPLIMKPAEPQTKTPRRFNSRRFLIPFLGTLSLIAIAVFVNLFLNARKLPRVDIEGIPQPPMKLSAQTVSSIVTLGEWQTDTVMEELAYSPDSTLLGSANNHYRHGLTPDQFYSSLWNVSDGVLHSNLFNQDQKVTGVDFSHDGQLLASTSDDGSVVIWKISDGSLVRKIDAGMGGLTNVDFYPNNLLLATSSWDGVVGLWQLSNGQLLRSIRVSESCVRDVEFSPDGTLLAAASDDQKITIWLVNDGSLQQTLIGHTSNVYHLTFSPDGALLASASEDKTVRMWQVSGSGESIVLNDHNEPVYDVAFSPDGSLLASGSGDGILNIWRVSDGNLMQTLTNQSDGIFSLIFSPDGYLLIAATANGSLQFWGISAALPLEIAPSSEAP